MNNLGVRVMVFNATFNNISVIYRGDHENHQSASGVKYYGGIVKFLFVKIINSLANIQIKFTHVYLSV